MFGNTNTSGSFWNNNNQQNNNLAGSFSNLGTSDQSSNFKFGSFGMNSTSSTQNQSLTGNTFMNSGKSDLFGSSQQSLFGQTNNLGSTSLFGNTGQSNSLFGSNMNNSTQLGNSGTGLFGSSTTSTVFGSDNKSTGSLYQMGSGQTQGGFNQITGNEVATSANFDGSTILNVAYGTTNSQDEYRWEFYRQNDPSLGATPGMSLGTTTGTLGTGLFGSTTTQPSSGLFGSSTTSTGLGSTTGTGLFGTTSTGTTGTGLFGSSTTTQPSTGLFGSSTTGTGLGSTTLSNTGSSLFGSTTTTQPSTGLFGSTTTGTGFGTSTGSGLFGSTTTQPSTGTGLFGSSTTSTGLGSTTGSGLFGSTTTTGTTGTGLFGSTSTGTTGSGLFGSTTGTGFGSTSTSSGLFGGTTTGTSLGSSTLGGSGTGLFGSITTPLGGSSTLGTTGSGLFGSSTTTQPSTGLFGSTTTGTGLGSTTLGSTGTGLFGSSTTGTGLGGTSTFGTTGTGFGSTTGTGLFGSTSTGTTGSGLFGSTTTGTGFGTSTLGGTGTGLFGSTTTGTGSGLFGSSTLGSGLYGTNNYQSTYGTGQGLGFSNTGFGQMGYQNQGLGLYGTNTYGTGLYGTGTSYGNYGGQYLQGTGVFGGPNTNFNGYPNMQCMFSLGGMPLWNLNVPSPGLNSFWSQGANLPPEAAEFLNRINSINNESYHYNPYLHINNNYSNQATDRFGLRKILTDLGVALPRYYINPQQNSILQSFPNLHELMSNNNYDQTPKEYTNIENENYNKEESQQIHFEKLRSLQDEHFKDEQMLKYYSRGGQLKLIKDTSNERKTTVFSNNIDNIDNMNNKDFDTLTGPFVRNRTKTTLDPLYRAKIEEIEDEFEECNDNNNDNKNKQENNNNNIDILTKLQNNKENKKLKDNTKINKEKNKQNNLDEQNSINNNYDNNNNNSPKINYELNNIKQTKSLLLKTLDTYPSKNPPILTKEGYTTRPTIELLKKMNDKELSSVIDFQIMKDGFGDILWPGHTDLRGINLDELIDIGYRKITVNWENEEVPKIGNGLNKKALITLYNCTPTDFDLRSITKQLDKMEKLKEYTESCGCKFISFNFKSGVWMFETPYFVNTEKLNNNGDKFMSFNARV